MEIILLAVTYKAPESLVALFESYKLFRLLKLPLTYATPEPEYPVQVMFMNLEFSIIIQSLSFTVASQRLPVPEETMFSKTES